MKKQVSSARTSLHSLFSEIIKENHKKMKSLDLQMKKSGEEYAITKGEDDVAALEQKINSLQQQSAKSSITVIVFAAMAVEAYIYDYAARNLGDSYVKDHLDKIDTLSKWVVIPEFITGRELSGRQEWYPLLKTLIKTRNSLIHHKSSELPVSSLDMKLRVRKLNESSSLIRETASQSITLLGILADKIAEVDPEETPWVQSYLT